MSEHTNRNPFINITTSGRMWRFLNFQYWTNLLEQETQVLVNYQTQLLDVKLDNFLMYKVTPVIMAVVLLVGITGNGLLLTVFVRHKETRTLQNSMLINLTVVDLISLLVNGLLDYKSASMILQLGWLGCKIFYFFAYFFIAVSTYSVAMISVQRFVVVWQLTSLAWCHQSQKSKYVLIAIVWGLGFILSMPHAFISYSENKHCTISSLETASSLNTADLITVCVVPLLITAVSSGLTAYRIRRSAREIPGEATGQQQSQHSRMVSSTVLFALTVLFVVSYAPLPCFCSWYTCFVFLFLTWSTLGLS